MAGRKRERASEGTAPRPGPQFGQTVLVMQGGGALGAYHAGVYQALHEAGIEPDWVIGTSIGAINGAIIAGNEPDARMERLQEFWDRVGQRAFFDDRWSPAAFMDAFAKFATITQGVLGFYRPNLSASFGVSSPVGVDRASFYSTEPLKATLRQLLDFDYLNRRRTRLTVGAVNACTGEMRYFDNRHMTLGPEHVMASGALPPSFPAIRVAGEPYWDGAIYSNTPIEVVLDDNPRRDSLIFSADVWQPRGSEPKSLWQVLTRGEEIVYSSRADSHIARQEQIHRLRHVIKELWERVPEDQRTDPSIRAMAAYGCQTIMHIVRLLAPRLDNEDHTKAIDFSRAGIRARWQAGFEQAQRMLAERPWERETDPLQGVVIHECVDT